MPTRYGQQDVKGIVLKDDTGFELNCSLWKDASTFNTSIGQTVLFKDAQVGYHPHKKTMIGSVNYLDSIVVSKNITLSNEIFQIYSFLEFLTIIQYIYIL